MGRDTPPSYWATYHVFPNGFMFEAVQITSANSTDKPARPRFDVINASATIEDEIVSFIDFTINWFGCNDILYVGLLNPKLPLKRAGYPTFCGDYCQVLSINFGKCALNTEPQQNC